MPGTESQGLKLGESLAERVGLWGYYAVIDLRDRQVWCPGWLRPLGGLLRRNRGPEPSRAQARVLPAQVRGARVARAEP